MQEFATFSLLGDKCIDVINVKGDVIEITLSRIAFYSRGVLNSKVNQVPRMCSPLLQMSACRAEIQCCDVFVVCN